MSFRNDVAKMVQGVRDDVQALVDNSGIDNTISDGLHKVADTIDVVADKVSDLLDRVADDVVIDKTDPKADNKAKTTPAKEAKS